VTDWQQATVVARRAETERATTYALRLRQPFVHRPGQHVVLRLTAPDGYTAQRSYSIASAPDDSGVLELTVERLEGGEVSTFLHDEVVVGDDLEVRGPIGGFFVWDGDAPAVLVGGGSGVVPLMSMLRHARRLGRGDLVRLVVSARTPAELLYADELPGPEVTVVHSRAVSGLRPAGRIVAADIDLLPDATAYLCGSSGFVDAAGRLLLDLGHPADRIKVERFGPSG
jgi:ferredoxin-NADP reductase